jgi:hypothetical protein
LRSGTPAKSHKPHYVKSGPPADSTVVIDLPFARYEAAGSVWRIEPVNSPADFEIVGQVGDAGALQTEVPANGQIVRQLSDAGVAQIEGAPEFEIVG